MSEAQQTTRATVGDLVVISGHHLGEPERIGEILEVLGEPGHEHYHVRWDDRESVFYPSSDASIRPAHTRQEARQKE